MTDWMRTAAFSRSRLAFLASLAALVDSRKASLLSLFEDIILLMKLLLAFQMFTFRGSFQPFKGHFNFCSQSH
jgi:hypothetical protein